MRVSVMIDTNRTVEQVLDQARTMRDLGFPAIWASQIFDHDTLTLLAVVGREVPGIALGTAVVPTYPRHPLVLAAQARTVQAATGGRLTLGIGLSHQVIVEHVFGMSFERPARHMREYLSVLLPALAGEQVAFSGEVLRSTTLGPLHVPGGDAPPVLLAALAPAMLRLAGSRTDGTVTWMTGPRTIDGHIAPSISAAASEAGRPAPRIVAGLPVCVTADEVAARERAARRFQVYGSLPSYRAMLDREGAGGPEDVAAIGSEEAVAAHVRRFAEAGATEFAGAAFGTPEEVARTLQLLARL